VFSAVRSQLVLKWFGADPEQRTLAVVGLSPGDGRSHVVANLARLFAQMDEDTLVIDADLRQPAQHRLLGVDNSTGLADYLAGRVPRPPIRAVPEERHLHVLAAGNVDPSSLPLLARRQFGLMLGGLAARYSFILIDTPPAAQFSEAVTVAVRSSGCLVVTRRHRTRLAEAQALADKLSANSVEVIGALINDI
jgi:protein-tyrosine kinase